MTLTYRDGVSIAELVIYFPSLAVALFLSFRHGFGRNSGWLYLIIFCLARIIGPIMQLVLISDPSSTSLYTGSIILQTVGLSPLMLASLGLLSRAADSINRSHHSFINSHILKLIQLVITVGIILSIIGGINASDDLSSSGGYYPGTLSKVGTALLIVSYAGIVLATIIMSFSVSHAEPGEKRLVLAVAVSLPFLLIRLVYSIMVTFSTLRTFNQIYGSVTALLCMALIEEFIVVVIYEGTGLTLREIPKSQHALVGNTSSSDHPAEYPAQSKGGAMEIAKRIAKKTIIGTLVTAVLKKEDRDVEMEGYSRR
jgi:hypothetical protein